jgi:hypothetical protein
MRALLLRILYPTRKNKLGRCGTSQSTTRFLLSVVPSSNSVNWAWAAQGAREWRRRPRLRAGFTETLIPAARRAEAYFDTTLSTASKRNKADMALRVVAESEMQARVVGRAARNWMIMAM